MPINPSALLLASTPLLCHFQSFVTSQLYTLCSHLKVVLLYPLFHLVFKQDLNDPRGSHATYQPSPVSSISCREHLALNLEQSSSIRLMSVNLAIHYYLLCFRSNS